MKAKRKFHRTSAGPAFHLGGLSHRQHVMVVLTRSRAPQAPLPCCLSLPSFQSQDSLPLWVPDIHPHPPSRAGYPQRVPPSYKLTEASISFSQEGARGRPAILCPHLCYSIARQVQAIQSSCFFRASRRWNRCNVRNQHLVWGTCVPIIMTFVNNSVGICIWEI